MRKLCLGAAVGLAAAWLWRRLPARPPLYAGYSFSTAVYDRGGRLLRLTTTPDGKFRLWVPLSEISPLMIRATILQEDQNFRRHPGFDPAGLVRAAWMTYVVGGRRIGGSTITMQLARLLYRLDSRTLPGKAEQLLRAVELEALYSKDEILEAYLNLAPYGGNIEGVGAACLIYFDKNPDQLNLSEALTLSVIPQNPVRRSLTGRADSGDARWRARGSLWARWLRRSPRDAARGAALEWAPPPKRAAPSFEAPHFCERLLRQAGGGRVVSTLDWALQKLMERMTRDYLERRRRDGLRNGAALLVDWRTGEVLAQVGSADYRDRSISGEVDGTAARRSPGSTLKPFVYGLAFDQGLIHPLTALKDAPSAFGAYDPENFDGDFMGPIPAREALIKSRNVPAVALAAALEPPGLYGLLQRAGAALPRPPEHYGLGIVLGDAEVTMEQLVGLYAALARGGVYRPLRRRLGERWDDGPRLLSPEASFLVMDALKDNPRPRGAAAAAAQAGAVYWKTGTSFGFRDAWAVGIFDRYALAVWIGDFSGAGNPAYVGADAAGPLFFRLVDAVRAVRPGTDDDAAPRPALNVRRVRVCAVSGKLPGPHCRRLAWTWFIPGVSPIEACDVHREVLVDAESGRRLCAAWPGARREVVEFWPSDLLKLFRQAGLPRRSPPPFEPGCALAAAAPGAAPAIRSPLSGVSYELPAAGAREISFSASADADAAWLYWFVDEALVGRKAPGQPLFWPARPGRYVVRVVDDRGRSDSRDLVVRVDDAEDL